MKTERLIGKHLKHKITTDMEKTINIIHLSNKLFKDAKPLTGKELKILEETYSKLLSKTPTKL